MENNRQDEVDRRFAVAVALQPIFDSLWGTKPGFLRQDVARNPLSPVQDEPGAPPFIHHNPFDRQTAKDIPLVGLISNEYGEGQTWPGVDIDEWWSNQQYRTWIQTTRDMATRSEGYRAFKPDRLRRNQPRQQWM